MKTAQAQRFSFEFLASMTKLTELDWPKSKNLRADLHFLILPNFSNWYPIADIPIGV